MKASCRRRNSVPHRKYGPKLCPRAFMRKRPYPGPLLFFFKRWVFSVGPAEAPDWDQDGPELPGPSLQNIKTYSQIWWMLGVGPVLTCAFMFLVKSTFIQSPVSPLTNFALRTLYVWKPKLFKLKKWKNTRHKIWLFKQTQKWFMN